MGCCCVQGAVQQPLQLGCVVSRRGLKVSHELVRRGRLYHCTQPRARGSSGSSGHPLCSGGAAVWVSGAFPSNSSKQAQAISSSGNRRVALAHATADNGPTAAATDCHTRFRCQLMQ